MLSYTPVSVGATVSFDGRCFSFGDEEAKIYNRLREKNKEPELFTLACCSCGRMVSFLFSEVVTAVEQQLGENFGFVFVGKEEAVV